MACICRFGLGRQASLSRPLTHHVTVPSLRSASMRQTTSWSRRSAREPVVRSTGAVAAEVATQPPEAINLTDHALNHLKKLRAEAGAKDLLLRVGVKQGGCSGLSYVMDFEEPGNLKDDDYIMNYQGGDFKIVCDPKSLLYLFGMNLDYSDALIGGGFQFQNPNAQESCGCGKSFGV